MEERINPARITDHETGDVYELDFNRESIRFAERNGFKLDEVTVYPVTRISELFYYAFRKNHRKVARDKTDKLIERWGGLPEKLLARLVDLYNQAATFNVVQVDEDAEKNTSLTLEL